MLITENTTIDTSLAFPRLELGISRTEQLQPITTVTTACERLTQLGCEPPPPMSLLDLPAELLHEIAGYLPDLHSTFEATILGDVRPGEYARVDALRALAQSCRRLRAELLPLQWRTARAYFTARNLRRKPRTREKMLERRMARLRRAAYLHPFVQTLAVTLDECTEDNWHGLVAFVRVLDALPRLQSVVIIALPPDAAKLLATALEGKSFPNIRHLTMPAHGHVLRVLRAVPGLRALTLGDGLSLILRPSAAEIAAACPGLRALNNVFPGTNADEARQLFAALHAHFPRVERMMLNGRFGADALRSLRPFAALRELAIRYRGPSAWERAEDVPTPGELLRVLRLTFAARAGGTLRATVEVLPTPTGEWNPDVNLVERVQVAEM
ncbi:hypothetical protein MIND_00300800 [Mycena indigotica]|uniref:F-box domain-containing protein n=1 Tax=Mycena indigotica TaxID=2126181 RepID=A0A8H6SZS1_9AGAR|nr:uncharacterized protein MIND_00300800 [Mycena indigotica]KAF7309305.1 hypothetical protein MIND_00300800 [Mycena indigotica]